MRTIVKIFLSLLTGLVVLIGLVVLTKCSSGSTNESDKDSQPAPLNITVLLDLSDRLTRDLTPSQFDRDTAIVNYLVDQFIKETKKNQLTKSQNCMRVMFYPQPSLGNIALLAGELDVNLSKAEKSEKKKILSTMRQSFSSDLTQIYQSTLETKNWAGCDIWGFFSDKDVDKYCIKPGYRNIVVILTDGYLFHSSNKIKEGNNYSYILPQTLSIPESGLISRRDGLDNLEVLMLELNPYDPKTSQQIHSILENWFKSMGVQKFGSANTTMPKNTESVIDAFLDFE